MTQTQPSAQIWYDSAWCGEYNYFYFIIFIIIAEVDTFVFLLTLT